MIAFFIAVAVILLGAGGVTVIVDPYFHYHKPLSVFQYRINDERYQNNGIVRHFDYDAVITGTSMTENFKTSEFDELFGVESVKVPFSGARYREINENLETAFKYHPDIKIIVRCLDYDWIFDPADKLYYEEESYPWYLYDDFVLNDVEYIFNKDVFFYDTCDVLIYTVTGGKTTDFDTYGNWMEGRIFGREGMDSLYPRPEKSAGKMVITEEDYRNITENITQNVTKLASENSDTEFYLFFSPYSIYFWDYLNQIGAIERQLEGEKYAIELLLKYDNIHLFSFFTEYDVICNVDNYKDPRHYREEINSQMLRWMKEGKYELTSENYEEYCEQMKAFYLYYDYDSMFE